MPSRICAGNTIPDDYYLHHVGFVLRTAIYDELCINSFKPQILPSLLPHFFYVNHVIMRNFG